MLPQLYVVSQNMLLCILAYIWFRPCQVYKFACETGAKNICDSQVFIPAFSESLPILSWVFIVCGRDVFHSFLQLMSVNGADIVLLLNNLMACMHATDGIIKLPSALCLLEWELLEPMLTDRAKQKKQKKKKNKKKTTTVKCTRSTWIQLVSLHAFLCL